MVVLEVVGKVFIFLCLVVPYSLSVPLNNSLIDQVNDGITNHTGTGMVFANLSHQKVRLRSSQKSRYSLDHGDQYHHSIQYHHQHRPLSQHEIDEGRLLGGTLGILILSQYILYIWKKRSYRTYQMATLGGVWSLPFFVGVYYHSFRFLIAWSLYSLLTGYYLRLSMERPLSKTTPTRVYSWFLMMHKLSYILVVFGYCYALLDVNQINPISFMITYLTPKSWGLSSPYPPTHIPLPLPSSSSNSVHGGMMKEADNNPTNGQLLHNHEHEHSEPSEPELLIIHHEPWIVEWLRVMTVSGIFYGLYFGVLTRDVAEFSTLELSAALGLGKKTDDTFEMSEWTKKNLCALCGEELNNPNQQGHNPTQQRHGQDGHPGLRQIKGRTDQRTEPLFKLKCNHSFHERCLRGWTIVGKQHSCPYCAEPVDLSFVIGSSPWQKQSLLWVRLLDAARYLIVWHPIILAFAHFVVPPLIGYHPLLEKKPHN